MAIAFRSAAKGGLNSKVCNKPTGTASGDILIAHLIDEGNHTITPPSGWTQIDNIGVASNSIRAASFWKLAGGSEPSSYTWTISGSTYTEVTISAFTGVDNTTPVNTHNTASDPSSPTLAVPNVTTTVANCMLSAGINEWFGHDWSSGAPTNYTLDSGTSDPSLDMAPFHRAVTTATTYGGEVPGWNNGNGGNYKSITLVALQPAAAGISVSAAATIALKAADVSKSAAATIALKATNVTKSAAATIALKQTNLSKDAAATIALKQTDLSQSAAATIALLSVNNAKSAAASIALLATNVSKNAAATVALKAINVAQNAASTIALKAANLSVSAAATIALAGSGGGAQSAAATIALKKADITKSAAATIALLKANLGQSAAATIALKMAGLTSSAGASIALKQAGLSQSAGARIALKKTNVSQDAQAHIALKMAGLFISAAATIALAAQGTVPFSVTPQATGARVGIDARSGAVRAPVASGATVADPVASSGVRR